MLLEFGNVVKMTFLSALEDYFNGKKNLSVVGWRIQQELRKQRCIGLETFAKAKKSIVVSRSFGKYLSTYDEIIAPLTYFVSSACAKLREQKSETAQIGVFLRTNPFAQGKKQYSTFLVGALPFYTASDFHVLKVALELLKNIYKEGYEYKKCGVYLFDFKNESTLPSNLFDTRDILKEMALFKSFDKIKEAHGPSAIFIAAAIDYSWKPKFLKKSNEFTTKLNEVMVVN